MSMQLFAIDKNKPSVARQQQHATMTLCVPISFVQEFVTVFFSPFLLLLFSTQQQSSRIIITN